jgi:hypothetical protein
LFDLKGAARPARQFYRPPGFEGTVEGEGEEPVDLILQFEGKMWDHSEGQKLLQLKLDLAVGLHNVTHRTKEAVFVMAELQSMDPSDHLVQPPPPPPPPLPPLPLLFLLPLPRCRIIFSI